MEWRAHRLASRYFLASCRLRELAIRSGRHQPRHGPQPQRHSCPGRGIPKFGHAHRRCHVRAGQRHDATTSEPQFGKGCTQFVSMTLGPDSNIIRLMSIGTSGPVVDQMRICGLPQPPSPAPPPMSPPSPPPTKLGADVPWAVPTLCVLLVAALALLVLIYRRHSHVSRDRANLRISRDRANVDLQMITHQVQRVKGCRHPQMTPIHC